MLETVWYLLILVLQVLQVNPQILTDKLQIDVFVASKPAYSFVVQGNAVQGQIMDAEKHAVFGEFESTRRLPQAYVVFPRVALDPEVEAAGMAGMDQGKDSAASDTKSTAAAGAKTTATAATATSGTGTAATGTSTGADAKKKDLYPFTIDFTKALKQLVSFRDKPRQQLEYPEAERFLTSGDKAAADAKTTTTAGGSTTGTKTAGGTTTATTGAAGSSATSGSAATAASGDKAEEKKSTIEIRQYTNRLVVTADFIQTVMIINFMQ